MSSNPVGQHDDWIAQYDDAAQPFALALERPTQQLLIVPSAQARDQLAATVKGITCLAWEDGARADISPLLKRSGRRVFLWLSNEGTLSWLGETLFSAGYEVSVVQWPGDEFDTVAQRPWPELRSWVLEHVNPWTPPAPVDDILPAEAPGAPVAASEEVEATPTPPSPKKRLNARQKAMKEHEEELARAAAEQGVALRGGGMTIDDWMRLGLHITNGAPTANVSNISLIFDEIKQGEIWYDSFLQTIMCRDGRKEGAERRWTDADDIRTTIEVQRGCGVPKAAKAVVADAVIEYAMRNVRNSLTDYVHSLTWDGVPRIDQAFCDLFDVEDSDYHREISRNFFKSLIARALWPGCKVDTMPVFEGPQGLGKSQVIKELGGEFYAVMKESPDTKDFYVFMAGKWVIEIAELDAFSRADVKSVKRALSTEVDRFRPPYGRHAIDNPRQCVFLGSVNGDDWNRDPTGARRFWPVACRAARPEIARANRDQYFAEAMHALMHDGERPSWWMFSRQAAAKVTAEQEARFVTDDWTDSIRYCCQGRDFVLPSEIYRELGFESDKDVSRAAQMRVAEVMKREGWKSYDRWDGVAKRSRRRWEKL